MHYHNNVVENFPGAIAGSAINDKFANNCFEMLHLQSASCGNRVVFSLNQGEIKGKLCGLQLLSMYQKWSGSTKYSESGVVIWSCKTIV